MHSALTNFVHNPNMGNLVDLYDPMKIVDRALRHPRAIFEGRRGVRHAALAPDFDLCETPHAYLLDGEFPGICVQEQIKLKWLNGHTLRVEGRVHKSSQDEIRCFDHVTPVEQVHDSEPDKVFPDRETPGGYDAEDKAGGESVHQWLNERREGLFVRTFNFPSPIAIDQIEARLSYGVLHVKIPKIHKSNIEAREIPVVFQD
jgi:HSP20 family molecular chaperone IbpA